MAEAPEIICERRGAAGLVILNRPQALNALTHGMVHELSRAMAAWENDPAVTRIVVTAAGERAFCAGGDIRALYDLGRAGRAAEALAFWRDEYHLNCAIERYPKPYVSLIDGIVMGGGVGVSLHGSHRIAGTKYHFAMPEVSIGFFPDVGATHALPRLPGLAGRWIALTGDAVKAADAVALGLAEALVPTERMGGLRDRLIAGEPIDTAVGACRADPGAGALAAERATIDRCFAPDTIEEILAALDTTAGEGSAFAGRCAATIRGKSPTSLKIALEQLRRGKSLDFDAAMATEFRIVSRIVQGHDFFEGVRAAIIDKDRNPRWRPERLDAVSDADVAVYFAPLGQDELFPGAAP